MTTIRHSRLSLLVFTLSVLVFLYILAGRFLSVYQYKFTGAVFEILWLPAILLAFACPVVSLIFWIRTKFDLRSLFFYSLLIVALGFLIAMAT